MVFPIDMNICLVYHVYAERTNIRSQTAYSKYTINHYSVIIGAKILMEEEKRIQWHSGFCAAVQLEFLDEKDMHIYEVEHTLNSKPLQVDLLVVKKNRDVTISKPLGAIFKGHNLMEFKSPKDHMDIDSFCNEIQ